MNTAPKPIRSPSYPNMSLREAVEEVGKIESQYRAASVDRTAAAKLIGYTALSGPANKALAALASYGLLERAGKGEARVTERARDILHAANPDERRMHLIEAAYEPDLFREIRERFQGVPVPPEDGVITYLNRQGFNPNAVKPAAKAFLDTVLYLQEAGASESHVPPASHREQSTSRPADGMAQAIVDHFRRGQRPPAQSTPVQQNQQKAQRMEGEQEIYREIGEPGQYVYVVKCGDLDEYLLDAMEAFVKRQKDRLKKEAKRNLD